MKFSFLDYAWIWGTIVVNMGLFFVLEQEFLRSLRLYFLTMSFLDASFFLVYHRPEFIYVQWYIIIGFLLWQALIVSQFSALLCPRIPRSLKGICPAVILAASIVNGKPGTTWWNECPTHHMLVYEIFCLAFLILFLCFSIINSSAPRFESLAVGFGMLLAAQSVACIHRLYVGISPFIWNACWLAGISFIVHGIITYEPASMRSEWERVRRFPQE